MSEAELIAALREVSTATLTTLMLKKGLRNVWLRGTRPLVPGQGRVAGRAFTLRFIPAREDLATPAAWSAPISTRTAVEAMPPGCIAVVASGGCTDAGVYGDILCARMSQRGVTALVTDGAVRDLDGITATGLPIWAQGVAAPPAVTGMTFVNWQEPVGCGGVAVYPDDVIVADADGAVVVPKALVAELAGPAAEQERLEAWILSEILSGTPLPGLYPPNDEALARYRRATSA
ncbi:ribonuclease activity regulator RraA [Methylobacterium platani]|uniref:Dimethylmenaquinone methyltransferase n=2 Tax=Methylobacterium platani TaxID=427683 RepID=A0A179S3D1_9HYPH|nr:ribonuclease activity regulator RraA [Methylobacterium platani]KMO18458.1 dimethylmenaquinone methyltransferase [Methylobacterium platani JCM 14648]OAS20274.1 dimethylmenaquinone methyltransferase [Methylobacterium platani]